MRDGRRVAVVLLAAAGVGCMPATAPPWQVQWVDTDAGSGPTVVIVQGPAAATVAPPLLPGYRVIHLIEPDDRPDPPAWRSALHLAPSTNIVIVSDADGAPTARRLAAEAPGRVRGIVALGGAAAAAMPDEGRWPKATLADLRGLAGIVARWLPPGRGTFTVQPEAQCR